MMRETFLHELQAHKGIIMKIVNLYADDAEDKKDLYQEIVYQSWSAYGRFRGDARFSTWLYRISMNVALTFLSKQKKNINLKETLGLDIRVELPELSERAEWLYRSIKQLPEIDRSIITLHLDGFDHTEISEMTGLSKNHTTVKLHRIKQQLTQILNQTKK